MDSTTMGIIREAASKYFDEALKQSPNNPQSNGFGLLVATLAGFLVVLLAVIWLLYRDGKRERSASEADRKKARASAAKQIDERFDKLEKAIDTGLDEIEGQTQAAITDLQAKHADVRQELTRLKTIIEMQK